jgi:hypothetical protein
MDYYLKYLKYKGKYDKIKNTSKNKKTVNELESDSEVKLDRRVRNDRRKPKYVYTHCTFNCPLVKEWHHIYCRECGRCKVKTGVNVCNIVDCPNHLESYPDGKVQQYIYKCNICDNNVEYVHPGHEILKEEEDKEFVICSTCYCRNCGINIVEKSTHNCEIQT